jgi:methionyl-tRNA formyltransferase
LNEANQPLRALFAGTPDFALPSLQALIDGGFNVLAVLTQPDRPAGRGKQLRASPVKQLAQQNGIEVLQPQTLKDDAWQQQLMHLQADLMIVIAYGLIIPSCLLEAPRLGCWNIHASLLPRWRGAAPIHRAIEAGDETTGVCIMRVEPALATGPVFHMRETPIGPGDTTAVLHDRLGGMGAEALMHCIGKALAGTLPPPKEQDHALATYAHKLSKAEAELDWQQPARVLERRVRAFNPWPVAWCELGNQRLRIWRAEVVDGNGPCAPGQVIAGRKSIIVGTGAQALKLLEIQRAGGQRMTAEQFMRAHPLPGE